MKAASRRIIKAVACNVLKGGTPAEVGCKVEVPDFDGYFVQTREQAGTPRWFLIGPDNEVAGQILSAWSESEASADETIQEDPDHQEREWLGNHGQRRGLVADRVRVVEFVAIILRRARQPF